MSKEFLSQLVHYRTYANFLPEQGRRESITETINRNSVMHIKKFPALKDEIEEAYKEVHALRAVPSMRSFQFAGAAIERRNNRMFNCSFVNITSVEDIADLFYMSMSGCGVGYSVKQRHVSQLPVITEGHTTKRYTIPDSAEGWADSLIALFENPKKEFEYKLIRPAGAKLSSGGTASGPSALIQMHAKVREVLASAVGRKLTSFEVHRTCCLIADCVVVGGVRRGALIVLFDYADKETMFCKSGNWWERYPELARANNSCHVLKDDQDIDNKIREVVQACFDGGQAEPGLSLTNDLDEGFNPCFTIDTKVLTTTGWQTFEDLLGTETTIVQDNRVTGYENNGVEGWVVDMRQPNTAVENKASNIRKTAESQEVFELFLNCGRAVKTTNNHHFATPNGMVMLKDLKENDEILIGLPPLATIDKESMDFKIGYISGLIFGDGGFLRNREVKVEIWGDENLVEVNAVQSLVRDIILSRDDLCKNTNAKNNPEFNKNAGVIYGRKSKYTLSSAMLGEVIHDNSFNNKDDISFIHGKSKDYKAGFISGVIYTDCHTEYNEKSMSISLRVTSTRFKAMQELQLILQELGVFSRINKHKEAGTSLFPDSNREMKEYPVQAAYRLIIGGADNCNNCLKLFKIHDKDVSRITNVMANRTKICKQKCTSTIKSIRFAGVEDVYCLQEDNRRTLIAEGMTARRCHEISLLSNSVCNLTEVNAGGCKTKEEFLGAVKAATIIGTLQASYTNFDYVSPKWKKAAEEDALLGVSITGQAEAANLLTPAVLKEAAALAVEVNKEWAAKIGINSAKRITTTKPSGTASSWLGTTAGVHAAHAERYVRRVRMDKDSALGKRLIKFFPHFVVSDPFNNNDIVMQIPIEFKKGVILRDKETAIQCLDRVKVLYDNWILGGHIEGKNTHNVSLTINYHEHEKELIKEWMVKNKDSYYGISLIPFSGADYQYAPYICVHKELFDILQKTFKETSQHFNFNDIVENQDNTDKKSELSCAGGACALGD